MKTTGVEDNEQRIEINLRITSACQIQFSGPPPAQNDEISNFEFLPIDALFIFFNEKRQRALDIAARTIVLRA